MISRYRDLFVRFGGHEQAAGLTVPVGNIPAFRERLNRVIRENCDDRCFLPVREYDTELHLSQVTEDLIRALDDLEPTGCGNPSPVFLLRGGAVLGGIAFGLGSLADELPAEVDALFTPGMNEFNGRRSPQAQVTALRPARTEQGGERELFLDSIEINRITENMPMDSSRVRMVCIDWCE